MRFYLLIGILFLACSLNITKRIPRDRQCFTQGLQFVDSNQLVQSCGHYNKSKIQLLHINVNEGTVKSTKKHSLSGELFGEGVTVFNDKIYQLTWQQNKVLVYSKELELIKTLNWPREGWGLCHNQTHMFVSDGSANIYVVNEQFQILQTILVMNDDRPVYYLNQLEYVKGSVFANVYMSSNIVQIQMGSGKVLRAIDARELVRQQKVSHTLKSGQVLNGIAYDKTTNTLLLTGKNWAHMYSIPLQE